MNNEELKKEFNNLMPVEVNGTKRPTAPIENTHDFFLDIPQLIAKDPVLYSTMNLMLSVLLSNDKNLKLLYDTLQENVKTHTHNASSIIEDPEHKFVTDTEKQKWNNSASGEVGKHNTDPKAHPNLFDDKYLTIPEIDKILDQEGGGGSFEPNPQPNAEEITDEEIDALFKQRRILLFSRK